METLTQPAIFPFVAGLLGRITSYNVCYTKLLRQTSSFRTPIDAIDWMTEMSKRLERRIQNRDSRLEFLRSVHYEATRAGLDPQLVLGLIQVESGFKKYAVSSAGARGYMQVMPFWTRITSYNVCYTKLLRAGRE